jgi:hypothetical protein
MRLTNFVKPVVSRRVVQVRPSSAVNHRST